MEHVAWLSSRSIWHTGDANLTHVALLIYQCPDASKPPPDLSCHSFFEPTIRRNTMHYAIVGLEQISLDEMHPPSGCHRVCVPGLGPWILYGEGFPAIWATSLLVPPRQHRLKVGVATEQRGLKVGTAMLAQDCLIF